MSECTCPRIGINGRRVHRTTCPEHGVKFPAEVKRTTGQRKTPADYWDEGHEAPPEEVNPYR